MKTNLFFLFIFFLLFTHFVEAQGLFTKKSPAQKSAQKSKKNKKAPSETNAFNPEMSEDYSPNFARNDYIWSSETAYTSIAKAGNISVTTPSRFGLKNNFELQTMLPVNYFVPNLSLKKSYHLKKIIIAHRHAIYSSMPGLYWAKDNNYENIIKPENIIPVILSMRNELIVSYPIIDDYSCVPEAPYLIFTAGIALDNGFAFKKNNLSNINEHVLGSRSPALIGKGHVLSTRLRLDGRLKNFLLVEADIKLFNGKFYHSEYSLEQHTGLQLFIIRSISLTFGYTLSYGHFANSNFLFLPYADLTFYFGKVKSRERGLFKNSR